ncbi:MAG: hypothetical protein ACRDLT_08325 [Solirubrobacteraceae bacterium]
MDDFRKWRWVRALAAPVVAARLFCRRDQSEAPIEEHEITTAVAAADIDARAAHRDDTWDDATDATGRDQPSTIPSLPSDLESQRRHRRPLVLLALAAILAVCLAVGAAVMLGGERGKAKSSHTVKHQALTPTVTVTTPAQTVTVPTTTTRAAAKPRVRKHHKKHRRVKPRKRVTNPVSAVTPPAAVTTPSAGSTTQTVNHSTPPVSSAPPASRSSSSTTTKTSSSSGESSKRSAGSGAVPAGGLPGVKQTEQMP